MTGPGHDQLIDEYVRRAMSEETPRVFGGNVEPPANGGGAGPGPEAPGKNRAFARRSYSTFNLILLLMATAVASVLYIGNIIRVGELANEVSKLHDVHRRNLDEQEMLHAQINRMSNLDRIRRLAEGELGMISPKQAPVWMAIDEARVQEVEESLREAGERRAGSR